MNKFVPLIHMITNSVTVNDTVNFVLAAGGMAICADSPDEAEEITSICDALVINIGTPSRSRLKAMLISGRKANKKGIPVVLDPVGAGASNFRMDILRELLAEIKFDCIRGNKSEVAALLGIPFPSKGVEDASVEVSDERVHELSKMTASLILMTGETDTVYDAGEKFEISGGSPLMKKITGSGCMYSAFVALRLAMVAGEPVVKTVQNEFEEPRLKAVRRAAADYKQNSLRALKLMKERNLSGTASFRQCLIDAMSMDTLGESLDEIR